MRKELKKIGSSERHKFTATFSKFGVKNSFGYVKKTILLINVKDENGNIVTEHLWWDCGKQFEELNLKENDVIEFQARVKEYEKGYKGWDIEKQLEKPIQIDYRLSNPTKVVKIKGN